MKDGWYASCVCLVDLVLIGIAKDLEVIQKVRGFVISGQTEARLGSGMHLICNFFTQVPVCIPVYIMVIDAVNGSEDRSQLPYLIKLVKAQEIPGAVGHLWFSATGSL